VIEALEASPLIQVVNVEARSACTEITAKIAGRPVFFYVYPGRFTESTIVRVTPVPMGCQEALLTPEGLYVVYWSYDLNILKASLEVKARATTALHATTQPETH